MSLTEIGELNSTWSVIGAELPARVPKEGNAVKCVICKHGETRPGTTTVTLERDQTTLVVKSVPARVCENCGEAYVDELTAARLMETAEDAVRGGIQVEVREYAA